VNKGVRKLGRPKKTPSYRRSGKGRGRFQTGRSKFGQKKRGLKRKWILKAKIPGGAGEQELKSASGLRRRQSGPRGGKESNKTPFGGGPRKIQESRAVR